MAIMLQTTFSNAYFWNKISIIWFQFYWSLFLGALVTLIIIDSDNGLVPNKQQAIIWANDSVVYCGIYASLASLS